MKADALEADSSSSSVLFDNALRSEMRDELAGLMGDAEYQTDFIHESTPRDNDPFMGF
jgi:hypothetical protein